MKLKNKNVVVIGGSRGLGRVLVATAHAEGAQTLAVARGAEGLAQLQFELPGVLTLEVDATEGSAPARVFGVLRPDVLVLCGGATPMMAPLHEQTWEGFSRAWESDVQSSFRFCQAALSLPLSPGTMVVLISSGAGLAGSSISGGYAGAKRTQMFLAEYAQGESNRLGLGLRFLALAPGMMPHTGLGRPAVAGYAKYLGISEEEFVARKDPSPTPQDVAGALLALVGEPRSEEGSVFTVSSRGFEPVA